MIEGLQLGDPMPKGYAVVADAYIEGRALVARKVYIRKVPDMAKLIRLARAGCKQSFDTFPRDVTLCELSCEEIGDDLWKGYHIFIKGYQTGLFLYVRVVPALQGAERHMGALAKAIITLPRPTRRR